MLRAGTGALINGWSPSLAEDDGEGYALFRVAGKKFAEASDLGPRPAHPIELFEYEGSPYCRKVREAAAVLDLDVLFRPCPSGETHWRPMAKAEGAATFPYLKDPNTGVSMIESDDIVEYLFRTYGPVANRSEAPAPNASPEELGVPFMLRRGGITNPTCYAAAVARLKALRARPSRAAAARGGRPRATPRVVDVRGESIHQGCARIADGARHSPRRAILPPREQEARRAPGEDGAVPGAVSGGSQHRRRDVRVGGDGGVPGSHLRAVRRASRVDERGGWTRPRVTFVRW